MKDKILKIGLPVLFWLFVWEIGTLLVSDSLALFLPSPFAVIKAFILLFPTSTFWQATLTTLLRVFIGLVSGSLIGIALGIITAEIKFADYIISPALKIIRAVPVVSFIILAFLFIEVDNLPIFISSLMELPLVWQNTYDGIKNTDVRLLEMAKVYKMGKAKTLFKVKIPSCTEQIISSLVNAVGLAWKSGIAAEVLCTPIVSIGKNIYKAKADLSFDKVYALTLTVVILSIIFEVLLKYIWYKYKTREVNTDA